MKEQVRDDGFLLDSVGIANGTHEYSTSTTTYRTRNEREILIEVEASFEPSRGKFPPNERDELRAARVLRALPMGERRRLRNLADSVTLGIPMPDKLYFERLASAIQKAALLWRTDEDSLADEICSKQTCVGILMVCSSDR